MGPDLNPKNSRQKTLNTCLKNPGGSGSFGQCFLGRYLGIDVIAKQMTHNETSEDEKRARGDLLHEAQVVSALGDYSHLPM